MPAWWPGGPTCCRPSISGAWSAAIRPPATWSAAPAVEQTQYAAPSPHPASRVAARAAAARPGRRGSWARPLPPGTRRVRVFPRGDVPVQAQWIPEPQTNEWVAIIESGVNFIVDGVDMPASSAPSTSRPTAW